MTTTIMRYPRHLLPLVFLTLQLLRPSIQQDFKLLTDCNGINVTCYQLNFTHIFDELDDQVRCTGLRCNPIMMVKLIKPKTTDYYDYVTINIIEPYHEPHIYSNFEISFASLASAVLEGNGPEVVMRDCYVFMSKQEHPNSDLPPGQKYRLQIRKNKGAKTYVLSSKSPFSEDPTAPKPMIKWFELGPKGMQLKNLQAVDRQFTFWSTFTFYSPQRFEHDGYAIDFNQPLALHVIYREFYPHSQEKISLQAVMGYESNILLENIWKDDPIKPTVAPKTSTTVPPTEGLIQSVEFQNRAMKTLWIFIGSFLGIILLIGLIVFIIWYCHWKKRRNKRQLGVQQPVSGQDLGQSIFLMPVNQSPTVDGNKARNIGQPRKLSL